MTRRLAAWVMDVAVGSLRPVRPGWAAAMKGEFDEASADGTALGFALGCLLTAWRELPLHGEGRLRLTSCAVALGLIVPIALINLSCSIPGFQLMLHGGDRYFAMLAAGSPEQQSLAYTYRATAPVMTLGIVALGLLHLLIAREVVRGRFHQVAALWLLTGLVALLLLGLAAWLFPAVARVAFTVLLGWVVELVSAPLLFWWQERLRRRACAR